MAAQQLEQLQLQRLDVVSMVSPLFEMRTRSLPLVDRMLHRVVKAGQMVGLPALYPTRSSLEVQWLSSPATTVLLSFALVRQQTAILRARVRVTLPESLSRAQSLVLERLNLAHPAGMVWMTRPSRMVSMIISIAIVEVQTLSCSCRCLSAFVSPPLNPPTARFFSSLSGVL